MFWHTAGDDTMFTAMRYISRHEDTQVYGIILPKDLTNQAMLESQAYMTYYAFAFREKTPKPKYVRKKVDSDTYPKQKTIQATKGTRLKTKAKLATKRSKTQFHSSHTSGSGYGIDTQSRVPDEQHLKTTGADEGIVTIPGVPDVPKYESESDDTNDDDKETDSENDEAIKELYDDVNVNLGNEDTDMTNADQGASEQQNVSQELRFKQVEEDTHATLTPVLDTQKADEPVQSSSVSSDITSKLLNLKNPSSVDNEIASLMETSSRHAMAVLEIKFGFTITIPLPLLFFNPLPQQATPTPTPTTSKATTSFTFLLDFFSVFKFNDRVTNLEKHLSKIKQVDQYAQALSSIPAIVDRYIYNKLREAINKAIQAHNLDCRKEAQDGKNEGDDRDKDRDPSATLDRWTKRKEPSHTVNNSGLQHDQEFDMGKNEEQPVDKEVPKEDWFEKPKRLLTPDSDWNKRQHLMDTSFDFSASILNWLKIKDLTQETLIGSAFELLKGTCKSLTLEYHLRECSKATTELIHSSQQTFPVDSRSSRLSIHPSGFLYQQRPRISKRKRIVAVTRLMIMKKYDYDYLEEIEVRREDQKLYKFREGNKDGIYTKEEMEQFRQTKGLGYDSGYRQAALLEDVDVEFREVR
nr:hypothetical protein [Tanacetum cinerariifolium]